MKLISPSSINKIQYINLSSVLEIDFETRKVEAFKEQLFVGNVVHDFIDMHFNQDAIYKVALTSALYANKNSRVKGIDLTNDELKGIQHNIDYCLKYLSKFDSFDIELKVFNKYDRKFFKQAIGGTADIVIHNDDDSVTIADFKNYNNPTTDDLTKAYYQTLVYANIIKDTQDVEIKEIQIVYPTQEQVITLPFQEVDITAIRTRY